MDNNLAERQINLQTINITNDAQRDNCLNLHTDNNDNFGFSNLPYRDPIDLQFKDITYTVNLGFNKGMIISTFIYYSIS